MGTLVAGAFDEGWQHFRWQRKYDDNQKILVLAFRSFILWWVSQFMVLGAKFHNCAAGSELFFEYATEIIFGAFPILCYVLIVVVGCATEPATEHGYLDFPLIYTS